MAFSINISPFVGREVCYQSVIFTTVQRFLLNEWNQQNSVLYHLVGVVFIRLHCRVLVLWDYICLESLDCMILVLCNFFSMLWDLGIIASFWVMWLMSVCQNELSLYQNELEKLNFSLCAGSSVRGWICFLALPGKYITRLEDFKHDRTCIFAC